MAGAVLSQANIVALAEAVATSEFTLDFHTNLSTRI